MHLLFSAHDAAPEPLTDRLLPKANAEQRLPGLGAGADQLQRNPRVVRRSGSGRDQEARGSAAHRFGDGKLVITLGLKVVHSNAMLDCLFRLGCCCGLLL